MNITACIRNIADLLYIDWDGGDWQDRSGGWPATPEGFRLAQDALKNDAYADPADYAAIDRLTFPAQDGDHTFSVALTADYDE